MLTIDYTVASQNTIPHVHLWLISCSFSLSSKLLSKIFSLKKYFEIGPWLCHSSAQVRSGQTHSPMSIRGHKWGVVCPHPCWFWNLVWDTKINVKRHRMTIAQDEHMAPMQGVGFFNTLKYIYSFMHLVTAFPPVHFIVLNYLSLVSERGSM